MACPENAKELTEHLFSLAKRKTFLREPAFSVFMQFFETLPPGVLQDAVLTSKGLQDVLCMDIGNANADTLLLALRLHKVLPFSVVESCPVLPNSRNFHAILEASHLTALVPILKDSSSCHPRLHPVWAFLIELLSSEPNEQEPSSSMKKKKKRLKNVDHMFAKTERRVAVFWKTVVDNALLPSSHERKYLAMELVLLLIPKLSASCGESILSKELLCCLLDILAAKGNLLYKSAQACLGSICEWAKTDMECAVTAIVCFQRVSHGKFDALSKTKSVKELLSFLNINDGFLNLHKKLLWLFNGDKTISAINGRVDEKDADQNGFEDALFKEKNKESNLKSLETQRHWIIEQLLSSLKEINNSALRWSLQKETLKFLVANALFSGPIGLKCYLKELQEEFQFPNYPLSDNTRKLCLERLQSMLVNTPSMLPPGSNKTAKLEISASSDLRNYFVEICDIFDNVTEVSRLRPLSEDEKQGTATLRLCISQLCLLSSEGNNEQIEKARAMHSLLMQLLAQTVTTGISDLAMELIMCCKKAFGNLIKLDILDDGESEEEEAPFFMDVLVETLLSLLAQPSAPMRTAAEQVFKAFCDDLTESNMLSISKVIKKQLNRSRRDIASSLDTGDSDEDHFLEVEDDDDDGDDDGAIDEDDHELEDNNESKVKESRNSNSDTEGGGNKGTKPKVNDEGMTKDISDIEDDSGSDMDDEAMFKIDVHLAKLLRQRRASGEKGEGKDAQTQLLHFQFRVLSLLGYFFQKKASNRLCLVALPALFQALIISSSDGGNPQLADRITSILQSGLFKAKEYPKGQGVDAAEVAALLEQNMKMALRMKIKRVRQVLESCCLWLMKVLQNQSLHEESVHLDVPAKTALNDFFYHRKCCLKAQFFREIFSRFPDIGLNSLGLLIESCTKARTEFLQHKALQLITSILHANCGKRNSQFKVSLLQNLPAISELIVCLVHKSPNGKVKKSEVQRFSAALMKAIRTDLPEKPVKKQIGKQAYSLLESAVSGKLKGNMPVEMKNSQEVV
ncbi:hypothetical protein KP509_13G063900 [Ceratopteris richardii]|nr:hypothetical protein KP509_13G063900 [Ceratopteris richardii]